MQRIVCGLGLAAGLTPLLVTAAPVWIITDQDPQHTVWEERHPPRSEKADRFKPRRYVELATGLNYHAQGRWHRAQPRLLLHQGRVESHEASFSTRFPPNLIGNGGFKVTGPNNLILQAQPLGVAYYDATTDRLTWLALPVIHQGRLDAGTVVHYPNALEGACRADARYTVRREGLEQDIILLTQPPPPETFQFDPSQTYLQVWTEFTVAPEPHLSAPPHPATPREFTPSECLDFGGMLIGPGDVFAAAAGDPFQAGSSRTLKSWQRVGARRFLVESIPYSDLVETLAQLPMEGAHPPHGGVQARSAMKLPEPPTEDPGRWPATTSYASARPLPDGVVIDFRLTLPGVSNQVFAAGMTYLVRDKLQLVGTTRFEEGAVVKMDAGGQAQLELLGPVHCPESAWNPACLTAYDDDTVGLPLPESTGKPEGYYALYAMALRPTASPCWIQNLQISHARYGLAVYGGTKVTAVHCQWNHLEKAIAWQPGAHLTLANHFLSDAAHVFWGLGGAVTGYHLTIHRSGQLHAFPSSAVLLTNCILAGVLDDAGYQGDYNGRLAGPEPVPGLAAFLPHLLPDESPWRSTGSPLLAPWIRDLMKSRSAQIPVLLQGSQTGAMILPSQIQPASSRPVPGYHHPRLDYLVRNWIVGPGTLEVEAGVQIGWEGPMGAPGFQLSEGVAMRLAGKADQRCGLICIQPPPTPNASTALIHLSSEGTPPRFAMQFTDVELGGTGLFSADSDGLPALSSLSLRNCQFSRAFLRARLSAPGSDWWNNLWHDSSVDLWLDPGLACHLTHNLFQGGALRLAGPVTSAFTCTDNLFLECALGLLGLPALVHHHNAYLVGHNRWMPEHATDILLARPPVFQAGPLGHHYYQAEDPSAQSLFDAGSQLAPAAGLFHYTTTDSGPSEGTSMADIGFHHVHAPGGHPSDSDADLRADYEEDADGSGFASAEETNPWMADTDLDGLDDGSEARLGRSPLQAGSRLVPSEQLGVEWFTPLEGVE